MQRIIIGLDHANLVQIRDWLHLVQMIKPSNYGISVLDNRLVYSKIKMLESILLSFIQMEHVLPVEDRIKPLRSGISEVKDLFKNMMLIARKLMKLISTQMEDTYYPVVMTLRWRYGIWDRDIFFIHFMVMRVRRHLLLSLHVEITLQQAVVTLLSWFGKVIWMKMNKNLLKISELRLVRIVMLVECLQLTGSQQREQLQVDLQQQTSK